MREWLMRIRRNWVVLWILLATYVSVTSPLLAQEDKIVPSTRAIENSELRVAIFSADVTIPLDHRCMGLLPTKSIKIVDPLYAHGIILIGREQPIVLVAVDWCEIRNASYDAWRDKLAQAVGTSRQRVLVASLHQHDAPVVDSDAARLLREVGLANELYDEQFHELALQRVCDAARLSLKNTRRITNIGTARTKVIDIASNRRIVEPDGRVHFGRGSSSGKDPHLAAAPEGEIDPWLKTISFWDGEQRVVELHSYATHPMSYYGRGEVTSDFVGLARERRRKADPSVHQIYFSGCSGDVTAGKYNDGSEAARERLIQRLSDAMSASRNQTDSQPFRNLSFRSTQLSLDFSPNVKLSRERLQEILSNSDATVIQRIHAAMSLASRNRVAGGQPIDFPVVDLGNAKIVLFPGESFVGYQLLASQMAPQEFVFPIGYGECWPGYVPTDRAFADNFEDNWLWTAPGAETKIRAALEKVLK